MTVLELYNTALALLNEVGTDAKDYPKLKLPYINQMLAQCHRTENWIRKSKGKSPLLTVPCVYYDSDVLGYDEMYVRECFPLLLASMLATDEDRDLAAAYGRMFGAAEEKYLTALPEQMTDVYGEADA